MKLDKFQFTKLISFISRQHAIRFSDFELTEIDNVIDIEMPTQPLSVADCGDVDNLMRLMAEGGRKIEAIKAYRTLTNAGLKEAKDAVEKYWVSKPVDKRDLPGIDGAL